MSGQLSAIRCRLQGSEVGADPLRKVGSAMRSVGLAAVKAGLACVTAAGCNFERFPRAFFHHERHIDVTAQAVVTREVAWRGWNAIEQTNGLVTLRHVAAAGGRTLSLEIGGDDAFYVNPEQYGRTYAAAAGGQGRTGRAPTTQPQKNVDFGGSYICVGPERLRGVDDQPFDVFCGPYTVIRQTDSPEQHELRMTSGLATSKDATITVERVLTLARGHTHVIVDETVTNHRRELLEASLHGFTQIDAVNRRQTVAGEGASSPQLHAGRTPAPQAALRRLSVYVPAPPGGGGRKQYRSLLPPDPAMQAQFDEGLSADVLGIRYGGVPFKVASRSPARWVAAVDSDSGWTYVKAFDTRPDPRSASNSGLVVATGRPPERARGRAVLELELLTGVTFRSSGAALYQREHWYATVCQGPVLALTPVGVVCEALHAERDMDYYDVSGRFGVFYLGSARLAVLGEGDEVLFAGEPMAVDPRQELRVSATLEARAGAQAIALTVCDHRRHAVGELARLALR